MQSANDASWETNVLSAIYLQYLSPTVQMRLLSAFLTVRHTVLAYRVFKHGKSASHAWGVPMNTTYEIDHAGLQNDEFASSRRILAIILLLIAGPATGCDYFRSYPHCLEQQLAFCCSSSRSLLDPLVFSREVTKVCTVARRRRCHCAFSGDHYRCRILDFRDGVLAHT